TETNDGPAPPAGVALAALPTATNPPLTLELTSGSTTNPTTVDVALDSYQFGFQNSGSGGSTGGGGGTGNVSFNDLEVTAPISGVSPQIFEAMASGKLFGTAVLTQRDAAGNPVAIWVLADVLIASDGVSGSSGDFPTEQIQMNFDKVTYVTTAETASWSDVTGTNTGPAPPAGVTLDPLPGTVPTVTVTDLGGVYSGAAFGVTAATVAAGNTTLANLGDRSLTVTYYVGSPGSGGGSALAPTQAGTYTVVAQYTSNSPSFTDSDGAESFTITQAPLTVIVNDQSKVYGIAGPVLTGTVSGGVNNDGITASFSSAGTAATATVAGSPYAITATLNDPNGKLDNYNISYGPGTLTVTLSRPGTASIYVLDAIDNRALNLSGSGNIAISGPLVVDSSSSSAVMAGANNKVRAADVLVTGGVTKRGKPSFAKTGTPGATGDPLAGLAVPTGSGGAISEVLSGKSKATIHPGVYSQIKVSGNARLTMTAGVYIIEGGGFTVSGKAKVTGLGVTIYNTSNSGGGYGSVTVNGNGTVSLTAPTSGPYAGILIFQDRNDTRALSFTGNARLTLSGTIYAEKAELAESGHAEIVSTSTPVSIVVDTMAISGNGIVKSLSSNPADVRIADAPAPVAAAYAIRSPSREGSGGTVAIVNGPPLGTNARKSRRQSHRNPAVPEQGR
ncbi:MAG: MBG domain-containing protein, partial [Fimbriimonadales bacterium]